MHLTAIHILKQKFRKKKSDKNGKEGNFGIWFNYRQHGNVV